MERGDSQGTTWHSPTLCRLSLLRDQVSELQYFTLHGAIEFGSAVVSQPEGGFGYENRSSAALSYDVRMHGQEYCMHIIYVFNLYHTL